MIRNIQTHIRKTNIKYRKKRKGTKRILFISCLWRRKRERVIEREKKGEGKSDTEREREKEKERETK